MLFVDFCVSVSAVLAALHRNRDTERGRFRSLGPCPHFVGFSMLFCLFFFSCLFFFYFRESCVLADAVDAVSQKETTQCFVKRKRDEVFRPSFRGLNALVAVW